MKRTVRSCLALILVVSMILGVSGIAYAAESTDAVQYVSLGDSMTNGYGLDGYLLDDGTNVNGYLQNDVEGAYPYLFQQYLKEQGSEVELTQLAMSGIRAEEVYYLLSYGSDNTFRADDYTLRAGYDRFDDTDLGKIDTGASGVANVAAKYQNSVKNADVLSLGLGNNNFGTFLTQRLCWYLTNNYGFNFGGNYYKTDLQALLASVDAELADQAMVIYEKALEILENQLIEQGVQDETLRGLCTTMAEAAVYSYVGFVISYAGILDYIAAKNPDAQVIIVGMANSLEGLEIVLPAEEGEKRATIDLGQFFGYVVDSANLYMAGLPAAYQVKAGIDAAVNSETASGLDVVYADVPSVDLLITEIAASNFTGYGVLRQRMVESTVETVFPLFEAALKKDLAEITASDVEAYEKGTLSNTNECLSCAVYLAVEKAITQAAKQTELDGSAVLALVTGEIQASFTKIAANKELQNAINSSNLGAIQTALSNALCSDETVMGLFHLFARFLIGDGIGCHPSKEGHVSIKNAMVHAYENHFTAADYVAGEVNAYLEQLAKLVETYGPEALEQVYQYAVENGYIAQLERAAATLKAQAEQVYAEALAELEAQLAELKAQAEQAAAEAKVQLEARIAELEAAIAELEAKLEEIQVMADAVVETVGKLLDAMEKAGEDAKAAMEAVQAVLNQIAQKLAQLEDVAGEINDVIDAMEAKTMELLDKLEQMDGEAGQAMQEIAAELKVLAAQTAEQIGAAVAAVEAAYEAAVTDSYTVCADSYYVAIGDTSAESLSYVDRLAGELEIDYKNLAGDYNIEGSYAVIENYAADVAKADLITIGFNNADFITSAVDAAFASAEMDWTKYVGEDGAVEVEKALEELKQYFVDSGMSGDILGFNLETALTTAVESYAYNAVAYAFNLPEVINAIRMVNEDAVIVVVGMYNPMDGAVIDLGDGTVLDISEYLDYLVEAAELHGVLTAMCTGSAIYVEAPDVATDVPAVISLMDLIRGKVDFTPNDEGHEYIKDQILKALTVTKEEVTGLLGDADGDGDVDNVDAMFILRYSVHAIGADRLNLAVCDVNGDGAVDNVDAMFVLRYSVHSIDRFPASK